MKKTKNFLTFSGPLNFINRSKARFIIAASQCLTERSSQAVTISKMHYFSEVKSFWPVQNSQPVTDAIKKTSQYN